ncbi:ABC transporter substrate-binding protein [Candidatus Woesearchaeota archaeon]|nr:ABC transporter substrate-binding protein [Candidatus Woesearchaeota archaeon]
MRKLSISGCFIFALLLLASCTQNAEQNPEKPTYKIGVMYPLTGDGAAYGIPIQKATIIAADEINAKGGINGNQLRLIFEDSKCNPGDGNSAAQKLINIDKVKMIIGGVCSGETLGAVPITQAAKVILISPGATSPAITSAGDYVFRVAPSDSYAGVVASNYASTDLHAKKAALITEATDYAQGLREVFKTNFKKSGTIVADEIYNPDDTDFRTQITKVKAANPDIIYLVPQTIPKAELLVKQIREQGLKQQLLTAEVIVSQADAIKKNAALYDNIIGIMQKFDENNPKAAIMLAQYKKQTGQEASLPSYMAGAYDIVYLLADAISKNGYDSDKIKDYLYAVKDYDGAVGKLTIDENGDPIMNYSIKKITNGSLIVLK